MPGNDRGKGKGKGYGKQHPGWNKLEVRSERTNEKPGSKQEDSNAGAAEESKKTEMLMQKLKMRGRKTEDVARNGAKEAAPDKAREDTLREALLKSQLNKGMAARQQESAGAAAGSSSVGAVVVSQSPRGPRPEEQLAPAPPISLLQFASRQGSSDAGLAGAGPGSASPAAAPPGAASPLAAAPVAEAVDLTDDPPQQSTSSNRVADRAPPFKAAPQKKSATSTQPEQPKRPATGAQPEPSLSGGFQKKMDARAERFGRSDKAAAAGPPPKADKAAPPQRSEAQAAAARACPKLLSPFAGAAAAPAPPATAASQAPPPSQMQAPGSSAQASRQAGAAPAAEIAAAATLEPPPGHFSIDDGVVARGAATPLATEPALAQDKSPFVPPPAAAAPASGAAAPARAGGGSAQLQAVAQADAPRVLEEVPPPMTLQRTASTASSVASVRTGATQSQVPPPTTLQRPAFSFHSTGAAQSQVPPPTTLQRTAFSFHSTGAAQSQEVPPSTALQRTAAAASSATPVRTGAAQSQAPSFPSPSPRLGSALTKGLAKEPKRKKPRLALGEVEQWDAECQHLSTWLKEKMPKVAAQHTSVKYSDEQMDVLEKYLQGLLQPCT